MVLQLMSRSPGDRAFCHRRLTDMFLSKPGWADLTPQDLTPASGRQDHTILPYAATSLVRPLGNRSQIFRSALRPHRAQDAAASTASHPYVCDDRETPLCVGRDGRICRGDLPDGESEIFFGKPEIRLDTPVNKPVDKLPDGQITGAVGPDYLSARSGLLQRNGLRTRRKHKLT